MTQIGSTPLFSLLLLLATVHRTATHTKSLNDAIAELVSKIKKLKRRNAAATAPSLLTQINRGKLSTVVKNDEELFDHYLSGAASTFNWGKHFKYVIKFSKIDHQNNTMLKLFQKCCLCAKLINTT